MSDKGYFDRLGAELIEAAGRRRGVRLRRIAARGASAAALLALGAGVALGAVGQSGDGGAPAGMSATVTTSPAAPRPTTTAPAGDLRVAVLNGTATSGLARSYAQRLAARGWKIGAVTNAPGDPGVRQTIVYATLDHLDEGASVAGALLLVNPPVKPIEGTAYVAAGGGAPFVVVLGADAAARPYLQRVAPLRPVIPKSRAVGSVSWRGGRLRVHAQGLRPGGTRYAVWLAGAPQEQFVGYLTKVGADGTVQAVARLADPPHRDILLTLQPSGATPPKRPGAVVLRGRLFKP